MASEANGQLCKKKSECGIFLLHNIPSFLETNIQSLICAGGCFSV